MPYSIPLKIDIVFKHVFTNDLKGLASLISCILFPKRENKVIEITILSSEIIPIFKDGKRTFLDLKTLAKLEMNTSDDPYVQIELQVYEQSGYVQRSLFYATGLIQNQLRVGDSYFQLSPVIQINLLDFELLPTENIVSRYLLKEEDSNHVLTQLFQMVYVELTKFKIRNISDLNSEREIWFYLLNNMQNLTEENRMEILAKKPDLKYAFDALDLYASDPDKRREFEERIRADKNYAYELAAKYEKGLEQGLEKGKIEKAIETAQKLLERGFSREEALEITGLKPEDLEKHGF
jgi:predicted transposase/invertase (TIGR01784 family)